MTRFKFVRAAISSDHPAWYGAAVTITSVLVASIARWPLGDAGAGIPFATYFPTIMVCTLLAGWRYGVASIVLSVLVVRTFFLPPGEAFFHDAGSLAPIAIFFVSCLTIVSVAQTLRTTFVQLEAVSARSEILSQELHHRVRNMMGVVQAMAQQSARSDPANFLGLFLGRLRALASAHDALANSTADTCSLNDVIDHSCTPFSQDDNITISGPPCHIPSHSCVPLTLAIHELCTNAIKHGAFSVPEGLVHVVWTVDSDRVAKISWQESGGPTVTPPTRRGLGTALLSSQRDIRKVTVDYNPQGVHCLIEVDGAELAASGN